MELIHLFGYQQLWLFLKVNFEFYWDDFFVLPSFNEGHLWDLFTDRVNNLSRIYFEFSFRIIKSDCYQIPVPIGMHQIAWCTRTKLPSIDHDCDFITQLLSFIHTVSCQKNRSLWQILYHCEKTSSADRIHPSGRFIQKETFWANYKSHSARKFPFVSTWKITGLHISKFFQIDSFQNQINIFSDISIT